MKQAIVFFCITSLVVLSGCLTPEPKMTQAALKAFETRSVDASFNEVYAAATEGLFDLGYTIQHSDKNTGVLVGEKRVEKTGIEWLKISDSLEGVKRPESDYYEMLQVTLFIQQIDETSTKVRIKTAVNKEAKLDKQAIDEMWVYIQRQVLMEGGPDT